MFVVADKPSPEEYNKLPGILAAHAAITPLQEALDRLVERGSEACESTLFSGGQVGAFLLHKHWEIQQNQCMIEYSGVHPSGKPALVTWAQEFSGSSALAPSRFRVDPRQHALVALEFSSDPIAVQVWLDLAAHPSFLENICDIVESSGLADKIGFATFDRASISLAEGEDIIEENWSQKSVLSAGILDQSNDKVFVQTGWAFVSKIASSCIRYCMSVGGSHCSHHHHRPPEVRVGPPVCSLHDD